MAWPMPPGQWNSGMPMAPDMSMGSYTPEQWTMMQQQSWQWAQWQQQYAQWQSQYGDKYNQQVQNMQAVGLAPPLPPSNIPPPAPPPPDKPPPPPHENDEPLFGAPKTPAPVPPPNTNNAPNNTQPSNERYGPTQILPNKTDENESQQLLNTEALKKLAEEERVFDIQFKKWEEEIEKWKQENVNHPDKRAYSEYEQKFEACRGQLLERRQQMKLKRAKLLNNAPQLSNNKNTGNISTNIPPPQHYNKPNNYSINAPPIQQSYKDNFGPASNSRNMSQSHQYKMPQHDYNRDNRNIDLQDPNEPYEDIEENYGPIDTDNTFLPTSSSAKGIPGLDLVPEDKHTFSNQKDVIDITDEPNDNQQKQNAYQKQNPNDHQIPPPIMAPDYSTISQGINNILGDEKIMNILSMVAGQKTGIGNNQNENSFNVNSAPPQAAPPMNNQWSRNDNNYNDRFNNRQPMNFNNQNVNFPPPQNQFNKPPPLQGNSNQNYDNRQDTNPDQYYDNNSQGNQYGNQSMHLRNMPPPVMQANTQSPRPLIPNIPHKHPEHPHVGPNRRGIQENREHINPHPHIGFDRRGMSEYGESNMPANRFNPRGLQENKEPPIPINPHIATDQRMQELREPVIPQMKPKWVSEPMFTPSIIVEYDHKPLRLKARDFIEPVHTFDYNHISKDGEGVNKRKFEDEADQLFSRKPRQSDKDWNHDRPLRDMNYRDNRQSRHESKDEYYDSGRGDNFYQRRYDDRRYEASDRNIRHDDSYREKEYDRSREPRERNLGKDYDRNKDLGRDRDVGRERDYGRDRDLSRDKFYGRDRDRDRDFGRDRDMDKDRDNGRDRDRDYTRDKYRDRRSDRNRSHSRDRESRKRGVSKESEGSNSSDSKKLKTTNPFTAADKDPFFKPKHVVMIDDILEPPGREMRPMKIVIVLRGPPGSGKSYLAKLIRDREAEHGGTARIMSIDDYFMQEGEIEEKDPTTGKIVKKPSLKYEYDESFEESYTNSLKRAFKRTITDGYFSFLIYDAVNDQLKGYADVWNFARQNGFQVYICTMDLDPQVCFKRNIHNRKLEDIEVICSRFFPTPAHHIQLDATTLLQSASIPDVHMEDVSNDDIVEVTMDEEQEVESSFTSKWEKMDDAAQLARLDGINKPLRPSQLSMEDYLQLDDWKPNAAKPGKKTVRWADLEERRKQEKMRAIGFVVGQTDWNRMTDPTMGSSALTQTKYIERVKRN